ncbi:MAG: glycerate kinase [Hyphomicrobiales bacterium]|nr:glycerate kinase [Hyphomicrobiales bacterium]
MNDPHRDFLRGLFDVAVAAVLPERVLPPHLPAPPETGRLIVLGAGKAAAAMAATAERHFLDEHGFPADRLTGLVVTRHGYGRPTRAIECVEAGHPLPDAAGRAAAARTLELAQEAGPDDLVLVLLSGGGSANWVAPAPDLPFEEKQALTKALLRCGATIGEINTVRKHLSLIKGGRLAKAASPGRLLTLAISDVPGDDPAVIASGPTVPDPTTVADARAVLDHYGIDTGPEVRAHLENPENETPKPGDPAFAKSEFRLVARPAEALRAAAEHATGAGCKVVNLGDSLEGEARSLAGDHLALAVNQAEGAGWTVILSGGEATVTLKGNGRGGPNQEYALGFALAAAGDPRFWLLAADTDGTDGGSGSADDPAGAIVGPDTIARGRAAGLDPAKFLAGNDSGSFFAALGDLLITGPIPTNVNDFRAILVDTGATPTS